MNDLTKPLAYEVANKIIDLLNTEGLVNEDKAIILAGIVQKLFEDESEALLDNWIKFVKDFRKQQIEKRTKEIACN